MHNRSSLNLVGESSPNPTSSNPKRRNCRRSKKPFILEESPVDTMADQRTMAELLRAPTEGYAEAIVVPPILAEQFELTHSLINMITSDQFFELEKDNPYDHIRWFNKITSTIKYKDVPNSAIKLMLFPFSLTGAARRWLEKEPPCSILTNGFDESFHEAWDRYKDLLHAFPRHGFTELHQFDTFYNALNPADQDSLNSAAGGNLLERRTQVVLTIIENKSKVRNSPKKSIVSQVKSSDANSSSSSEIAKLTHAVNQQTSAVTTAMTAILKQFQATPPPAFVKAFEEIYVTFGGAHPYYQCLAVDGKPFLEFQDNIQGYVSAAAVNYNQGNSGYRPLVVPLSELEKIKKMNEINLKAIQTQINNVKNELRNEMKTSIQASMSNQTNKLKNIMASFFQMNTAPTLGSGPLPSNTIANPKGELKAITTRSGLVLDGPSVPMPPPFINSEEDERVEETLTNPKLGEFTSKVPPHLVYKAKPPSKRNYVQLHINITLADALILILKYQKMLKALLSNKEKLLELANTPLNENFSTVILKKLPEKLRDPGKFLISYGFSELKCKALANLANRAICTPAGIARVVFVSVGKFIFPTNFVIVDYESDPRVPLILGRRFLWTARALIDVHGEEMILRDGDERLTLNMRHDTSSYSNQPKKESINMINIFNDSYEDYLEDLEIKYFLNHDTTKEMDSILEDSVDKDNLADPNDKLFDTIPEMFIDKHTLDYSSPPLYDEYDDDDFFEFEEYVYNDPFDSKEDKIKESKLLIDELDPLRSSDFLPSPKYDSFLFEDFSEVDALPSTNNEDKVFNPGILIYENLFEVTTRVAPDKNVKKISNASLYLEDFDPLLSDHELPFHKEVLGSKTLLSLSSENEEKVFKPEILTSKGVHTSLILELSHRGPKAFKVIKIYESPMEIFPCSHRELQLLQPSYLLEYSFYMVNQLDQPRALEKSCTQPQMKPKSEAAESVRSCVVWRHVMFAPASLIPRSSHPSGSQPTDLAPSGYRPAPHSRLPPQHCSPGSPSSPAIHVHTLSYPWGSSCDSAGHIEAVPAGYDIVPAGHVLVSADRYIIC
nr:hypothetical protein [Tanacetum cinerariifolium]